MAVNRKRVSVGVSDYVLVWYDAFELSFGGVFPASELLGQGKVAG